ncbi:hypothetical protein ACQP2U_30240 [Nocardia sp. CA-084685]|uniref:hypothetical protein n=1 Tax=Nocardia sp. CA-084685 TaxID=3239970 RepID=UPI003D99AA72
MNLDFVPGELPVIAARLGISADDLMLMLHSKAPASVPMQPGHDDISPFIPAFFGAHAISFFPATVDGAFQGARGAVTLPEIDISYTVNDEHYGAHVVRNGVVFDK